jgi:hypothetical protein
MCLVHSWNTGLAAIWSAAWLSQCTVMGEGVIRREDSKRRNQRSSLVAVAIDLYSAFVEERETICCFLVFHEIREELSMVKYPVVDRRVIGQPAQSESQ